MSLEDALDDLPIFPLPGAVLFPQAYIELHVFEPRYRAMLEASLETHRMMAIAQIRPGTDSEGNPRIATIAGVGSIERRDLLSDGRSHIVLVGRARVVLEEKPFVAPFRRAQARVIADLDEVPPSAADELLLLTAIRSFAEALRKEGPTISFERPDGVGTAELAHHTAQHLIDDPRVKQEILEMRDARERVVRVAEQLLAQRAQLRAPDGGAN